jgi:hypothetical protein
MTGAFFKNKNTANLNKKRIRWAVAWYILEWDYVFHPGQAAFPI